MVMCGNNHWIFMPNWSGQYKLIQGQGDRVLFMATSDRLPSHPTNKDGSATDRCFGLIGPRQRGVLMVIAG